MDKWKCLATLITGFVTPPSAAAQDAETLFSLSLQELSQLRVSIASRVDENFIDAPSLGNY